MKEFITGLWQVLLYSVIGVLFVWALTRFSQLLFGMNLSEEIRKGNKAAATFGLGIFILIGLIIGLIVR